MHKSSNPTVVARNLSKTYWLGPGNFQRRTFRQRSARPVEALKPMNLVSYPEQCIGVLGRNGSGKSTFLNLIAGIEKPTSGEILVSSHPTILSVSAALQGHLTGRENIYIGLLAMGLTQAESKGRVAEVLDWAELTAAGDRPMSTYSSGMRSRLKFAISTAVPREILLVDEALSTGDSTFAQKAERRMNEFLADAGTVFIVSHAAGTIEKFCNRAIWLHDGEMIGDGSAEAMTKMYRAWSRHVMNGDLTRAQQVIDGRRSAHRAPKIALKSELSRYLRN